jgi:tetratricopeptide (TPR) repeat protein
MSKILKISLLIVVLGTFILLAAYTIAQFPHNVLKGKMHRIDRFKPHFSYILELSNQTKLPDQVQLRRYIQYYKYIQKQNMQDQAMKSIMAFCYFYQGQTNKAQELYLNDINSNPDFFWTYYNLGVIYLSQKNLEKSKEAFQKAISLNPNASMQHIYSAKSYFQIILSNKIPPAYIAESLNLGHQRSLKYLEGLRAIELNQNQNLAENNKKIWEELIQHSHLMLF